MSTPVNTPDEAPDEAPARERGRAARLYGASPWHLVVLLGCFAITAYTLGLIRDDPTLLKIAIWFVGAAVVWDLVVGPLIALADRALRPLRSRPRRVSTINHVRVPALTSALLLLVWAPAIFQRSEQVFRVKAGLGLDPYLGRWLAITAVLFVASGVVYAIRWARAGSNSNSNSNSGSPATVPAGPTPRG